MNKDWKYLFIFLAGAMFASLTSDPISDTSFFYANSQGALNPYQELWYWYYLPFLVYAGMFLAALLMRHFKLMSPQTFTLSLILLTGIGTAVSLSILGFHTWIAILVILPFVLFAYILSEGVHIHIRRRS
jgi:hypothetical protein